MFNSRLPDHMESEKEETAINIWLSGCTVLLVMALVILIVILLSHTLTTQIAITIQYVLSDSAHAIRIMLATHDVHS